MSNKLIMQMIFIAGILTLTVSLARAGVSSPYWDDNPLIISPGETKDVALILQNMVGGKDIVFQAELSKGAEIASLTDRILDYEVPFGREDINVNLRVNIPEETPLGTKYNVEVTFREIKLAQEGMVHLGSSISKSFPVVVEPQPEPVVVEEKPFAVSNTILVIVLALVLIIGYFLLKKKKDE